MRGLLLVVQAGYSPMAGPAPPVPDFLPTAEPNPQFQTFSRRPSRTPRRLPTSPDRARTPGARLPAMAEHAAFLRGMNVGGHRITNEDLRTHLTAMGLKEVATFRASGTAVFA